MAQTSESASVCLPKMTFICFFPIAKRAKQTNPSQRITRKCFATEISKAKSVEECWEGGREREGRDGGGGGSERDGGMEGEVQALEEFVAN